MSNSDVGGRVMHRVVCTLAVCAGGLLVAGCSETRGTGSTSSTTAASTTPTTSTTTAPTTSVKPTTTSSAVPPAPMTSCTSVVHIGDSTSDSFVSDDFV